MKLKGKKAKHRGSHTVPVWEATAVSKDLGALSALNASKL
jgi:hypothetical protein